MDRKEMEKYIWFKNEIRKQEKRLDKLSGQKDTSDVVSASLDCFPYVKTHVKISGLPDPAINLRKKMIEKSIKKSNRIATEIEKEIDAERDPRLREILRCKFLDGMTDKAIGKEMYMTERNVQLLMQKYFESKENLKEAL